MTVRSIVLAFIFGYCWITFAAGAAGDLTSGKLLVASHELEGPVFEQSVVLLLEHGDDGTIGLIVNRPMDIEATDAAPDVEFFERYSGPLYFGGPVAAYEMRALLYAEGPVPAGAQVFDRVYLTPFDDTMLERLPADASQLRFFVGYAGWSPGQLEYEMERGSWHIRSATVKSVFAEDEDAVWQQLVPPLIYEAAVEAPFDDLE